MSERTREPMGHTATVTGYVELVSDPFTPYPDRTRGDIVVTPPIHTGEGFSDAVLGDNLSVSLLHVITTGEATLFRAVSSNKDGPEARQADIRHIAERIGALAHNPWGFILLTDPNSSSAQ